MSGAALVALLMLCAAIWMAFDFSDPRRIKVFGLTWAIALYSLISGVVLQFENALFPMKFDGVLYQIDSALGVSTFSVAHLLRQSMWPFLGYVYMAMLPMMVLWCALDFHLSWKGPSILWAYLLEMFTGPMLYAFVPACGPLYAFPGFPEKFPSRVSGAIALQGLPNAMPSLHLSTAMLLFLFARGGVWKAIAGLFVIATALATLATGEHYIIDLVVAVPFACAVHAATYRRLDVAGIGLLVVIAGLLALRFQEPWLLIHPLALKLAAIVTLSAGFWYAGVSVAIRQTQSPRNSTVAQADCLPR